MKKSPNKTVKQLRKILGKSQRDFAAMLGVSVDLIKSVECGRAALADKLIMRIAFSTGAMVAKGVMVKGRFVWKPLPDGRVMSHGGSWGEKDGTYGSDSFRKFKEHFLNCKRKI